MRVPINHELNNKRILSGNEAVARAAIEAGVNVVTSYPGEPIALPIEILAREADRHCIHVEWSINEKVAYEVALGSSLAGLRALVCVKHVGFNWILDPFMGSVYTGVKGGLVVVVGDDPSAFGSTTEEDTRFLTELAEVPLLEPSTPDETKRMIIFAYKLSEEIKLPVVVRMVTRLSRKIGMVEIDKVKKKNIPSFGGEWFAEESLLFQHQEIHRKNLLLEKISEDSDFNTIIGSETCELGIIGCGSAYQFVKELVENDLDRIGLFKIGFVRPPPKEKIIDFGRKCKKILVVEEVQPFLESIVIRILNGVNSHVYGKHTEHLPWVHELRKESIITAVEMILGSALHKASTIETDMIKTSPYPIEVCRKEFEPRCPHKSTFSALRAAIEDTAVPVTVVGDVGCMSLDIMKEDPIIKLEICMGSSPGVASGIKLASMERRVVSVLGDSSFYHSGIQGLINSVYNKIPIIVLVLDNLVTAQSGFQPDPGSGFTATHKYTAPIPIERIVKATRGDVMVVDAFKPEIVKRVLSTALINNDPTVIVSRGKCPRAEK